MQIANVDPPMDVSHPYVSVIIPVYNGGDYLNDAIVSVLNQTYHNYEIIVVDDGSADNTWEIIESYGDKIRGFHKENGGVSTALNYAIEVMRGKWFAWLSHDDIWLPNKLEMQVAWMRVHPNCGMYYSGSGAFDSFGERISRHVSGIWYPKGKDLRKMIRSNSVSGITVLVNNECFTSVGRFNEEYRCVQDLDMWFRIARKYDISCLHEPLAMIRVHPNQTGVRSSSRCRNEYISWTMKILAETPLDIFYPALSDPNILYITKTVLKHWAGFYVKYTRLCVTHRIPTLSGCIMYVLNLAPVSIRKIVSHIWYKIMRKRYH